MTFWPTTPGHEVLGVHAIQQQLCEVNEVGVGVVLDHILQFTLLDAEIEEASSEDLDVPRFVESLGGEKALAWVIRRRIDQAGRGGQGATFAYDELYRRADRLFTEHLIVHDELGLSRVLGMSVDGPLQVSLGT